MIPEIVSVSQGPLYAVLRATEGWAIPVLAVSWLALTLILERCLWWCRLLAARPEERAGFLAKIDVHKEELWPLVLPAALLGLLGNLIGLSQAFLGMGNYAAQGGVQAGTSVSFLTTGVGISVQIMIVVALYALSLLARWQKERFAAAPSVAAADGATLASSAQPYGRTAAAPTTTASTPVSVEPISGEPEEIDPREQAIQWLVRRRVPSSEAARHVNKVYSPGMKVADIVCSAMNSIGSPAWITTGCL